MTISDSAYVRRFFSLYSQEEKDKVRGHAFYPTDYISALLPSDVAFAGVVRSPHSGAKFSKINESKLKNLSGVIRVITARDIPKNAPFGNRGRLGQLILADKQVRYRGEPVALIVAENREALRQALDFVEIDWKPETTKKEVTSVKKLRHRVGKLPSVAKDLVTKTLNFKFPSLQARYLEPEAGWVAFNEGQLNFHIGSLLSESQRLWLSEVLKISPDEIGATESPLGGAFGGRQQRELIAFLALSAFLSKRSVCLSFSPKEQDVGSYGYEGELSLSYESSLKRLVSLTGSLRVDAGSYAGNAELVLQKALEHAASVYQFSHIDIEGEIVITPTHPRRALRGEGLTAITWVIEELVEKVAKLLEISPVEFRVMNLPANSEQVKQVAREIEKLEKPFRLLPIDRNRPIWEEKELVGKGFAFQKFQLTTEKEFDHSEVSIELQHSGTFLIRTSNLTLDLHAKSALCEVASAVLKTHPKAFTVIGKMREDFDKAARRETYPEFYYLAQVTYEASTRLAEKLLGIGEKVFNSKDVGLKDGAIVEQHMNRKMGYREVAFTSAAEDLRAACLLSDVDKPHGCSAGAVARVSSHPLTGEMRVESVRVVLDAGPVFYQKGLEIQVETAVSWAMAAVFSSEIDSEQPIPTPLDGPEEVSLYTIQYPLKDFPEKAPEFFGSRGIVDVLMSVVLGSLVNAIQDAKGNPVEMIPMSLEFMYPKSRPQNVHTLSFRRDR